LLDENQDSVV